MSFIIHGCKAIIHSYKRCTAVRKCFKNYCPYNFWCGLRSNDRDKRNVRKLEQRIKSFSLTHIYGVEGFTEQSSKKGRWEEYAKRCHIQLFINFVAKIRKSVWCFDRVFTDFVLRWSSNFRRAFPRNIFAFYNVINTYEETPFPVFI